MVSGQPASVTRSGLADPRIRFSYNIIGPPSDTIEELVGYLRNNPVNTTVGVSLAISLPFGNYLEDKLLNIGFNRLTLRPQIGLLHNWNKWSYELTGSVFIFGDNNAFFNGNKRTQAPIYAIQTHLNYRFSPAIWTSIGVAYGSGGTSEINDASKNDLRKDVLVGYSLGLKLSASQSLKLSYLRSATQQNIGNKTNNFALIWIISFE